MKRLPVIAGLLLLSAPLLAGNGDIRRNARALKDRYIVVFKEGAVRDLPAAASAMAHEHGGRVGYVYTRALQGFSVEMTEGRARALANDPRVDYVEEDGVVTIDATQSNATWGLDRTDQRDMPLNGSYTYNYTGAGVRAYIIDTGVLGTHNEFSGRMAAGYTAISDGRGTTDCNGHGTHVAGTVGGSTYGIAKGVTIVPVRVLDCNGSGTNSGVIAGVDWVTADHAAGVRAVANMSLGGGANASLDTAVRNSITDGVTYAVASGNDNADACNYSPARVGEAITVNSSTNTDARSSFSNFGSCTDIFAPGSSITSAWYTSNTATNTISGTSMATPHVAGVAALYLEQNGYQSPSTVWAAIRDNSTLNKITSAGTNSPNRLLYSIFGGTTPPPPSCGSSSQLFGNAGFESGNVTWVADTGVIGTGGTPRTGSWNAWMNGYGNANTDYVYQQVTIPSNACSAKVNFYLYITTAETTTTTAYDKLTVTVRNTSNGVLTTLATFSNLNKNSGYALFSYDVSAYKGQTVRIYFNGTEDSSLQTSFRIDDTSLNVTQ